MDILNALGKIQDQLDHLDSPSWDYKVVDIDVSQYSLATALKEYGQDGWELVQMIVRSVSSTVFVCVFKRRMF